MGNCKQGGETTEGQLFERCDRLIGALVAPSYFKSALAFLPQKMDQTSTFRMNRTCYRRSIRFS
jgi:hypothetical protein